MSKPKKKCHEIALRTEENLKTKASKKKLCQARKGAQTRNFYLLMVPNQEIKELVAVYALQEIPSKLETQCNMSKEKGGRGIVRFLLYRKKSVKCGKSYLLDRPKPCMMDRWITHGCTHGWQLIVSQSQNQLAAT